MWLFGLVVLTGCGHSRAYVRYEVRAPAEMVAGSARKAFTKLGYVSASRGHRAVPRQHPLGRPTAAPPGGPSSKPAAGPGNGGSVFAAPRDRSLMGTVLAGALLGDRSGEGNRSARLLAVKLRTSWMLDTSHACELTVSSSSRKRSELTVYCATRSARNDVAPLPALVSAGVLQQLSLGDSRPRGPRLKPRSIGVSVLLSALLPVVGYWYVKRDNPLLWGRGRPFFEIGYMAWLYSDLIALGGLAISIAATGLQGGPGGIATITLFATGALFLRVLAIFYNLAHARDFNLLARSGYDLRRRVRYGPARLLESVPAR